VLASLTPSAAQATIGTGHDRDAYGERGQARITVMVAGASQGRSLHPSGWAIWSCTCTLTDTSPDVLAGGRLTSSRVPNSRGRCRSCG